MSAVLLIIAGMVEAGAAAGALFFLSSKGGNAGGNQTAKLEEELKLRKSYGDRFEAAYGAMIDIPTLRERAKELKAVEDSLKAERGRITITQAELETVEARLRELEEIERELEASGLETKEEFNILTKKQAELVAKNDALKAQIAASTQQLQAVLSKIEMSAQMREQVQTAQTELVSTETKIDTLLLQIEQGNEQYFILKRRYDALDIEYAQLYEKFSESEAAIGGEKKE